MTKDTFQVLADELTLIRNDMARLQRTSLNKDEAEKLHRIVVEKAEHMAQMGPILQRGVEQKITFAMTEVAEQATRAAQEAAERAVVGTHTQVVQAAQRLLDDAQTVRSVAWRQFGDFWAWIGITASVCLVGASLATMAVQGRGDAKAFGRFPGVYCTAAGGQRVTGTDGGEYCAVLITAPRERSTGL